MDNRISKIQNFLANNNNFEILEAKLNEFNPLKVLKVNYFEIRHSNILSWLLDPTESHNFRELFLRKFLIEILVLNDNITVDIAIHDLQNLVYDDFFIKREWKNVDLLIVSKVNKLVILIENKIHAKESKNQLEKYIKIVETEFSKYKIIPVFLTLDGEEASHSSYANISYMSVQHILKFVLTLNKDHLNNKICDFIQYYLQILKELTMTDTKLKSLCKIIYQEHKEALDLIYSYSGETQFEEAAINYIRNIDAKQFVINNKSAWFIPNIIFNKIEKVGDESWQRGYPIAFWFIKQSDEKIGLIIEIGPFSDSSKRIELLQLLENEKFKIPKRAFQVTSKFTRIYSKYIKFNDWDNQENVIEKFQELYEINEVQAKLDAIEKICSNFKWAENDI